MSSTRNMHTINLLPARMTWIRLNRILAWTLMFSPLVQLLCRVSLGLGMQIDLCLLLAHGALSLVLFGAPKDKWQRFNAMMHVLGGRPEELSARNRFLLSGYRIALGLTPVLFSLLGLPWLLALPFLYPVLRLPISTIQHIDIAAGYAMQRLRWKKSLGTLALALYLLFSIMNLVYGLFGTW